MESVLDVEGLAKLFGEHAILSDVHLRVERGSMVVLTGRSGSGKSTLFKLLAGLDRPTQGRIMLEGVDLAGLDDGAISDARLRRIGLVFQSPNLLPDLTAHENARLPLDLAGVSRREADERAAKLLELVGVLSRGKAFPNELSGGEAQRVAVARALANAPAIVLADEPTASLDRANAERVLDVLDAARAELGATIVLITHDPLAVARYGSGWRIEGGRLVPTSGEGAQAPGHPVA